MNKKDVIFLNLANYIVLTIKNNFNYIRSFIFIKEPCLKKFFVELKMRFKKTYYVIMRS